MTYKGDRQLIITLKINFMKIQAIIQTLALIFCSRVALILGNYNKSFFSQRRNDFEYFMFLGSLNTKLTFNWII